MIRILLFVCFVSIAGGLALTDSAAAQGVRSILDYFRNSGTQAAPSHPVRSGWAKIPAKELDCIDKGLRKEGTSVKAVRERGMAPTDQPVAKIRAECHKQLVQAAQAAQAAQTTQSAQGAQAAGANAAASNAAPAPAFAVDGLTLGGSAPSQHPNYAEFQCGPSAVFAGLTWCQRSQRERVGSRERSVLTSILHTQDGRAAYVNRVSEPALFGAKGFQGELDRVSARLGPPAQVLRVPRKEGLPDAVIASWGTVQFEPLEADSVATLAAGGSPRKGLLADYLGNFQRSAQLGLPIYRLAGGSGYVWVASADRNGRGHLRTLVFDAELAAPGSGGPTPVAQPATQDAVPSEAEKTATENAAAEPAADSAAADLAATEKAAADKAALDKAAADKLAADKAAADKIAAEKAAADKLAADKAAADKAAADKAAADKVAAEKAAADKIAAEKAAADKLAAEKAAAVKAVAAERATAEKLASLDAAAGRAAADKEAALRMAAELAAADKAAALKAAAEKAASDKEAALKSAAERAKTDQEAALKAAAEKAAADREAAVKAAEKAAAEKAAADRETAVKAAEKAAAEKAAADREAAVKAAAKAAAEKAASDREAAVKAAEKVAAEKAAADREAAVRAAEKAAAEKAAAERAAVEKAAAEREGALKKASGLGDKLALAQRVAVGETAADRGGGVQANQPAKFRNLFVGMTSEQFASAVKALGFDVKLQVSSYRNGDDTEHQLLLEVMSKNGDRPVMYVDVRNEAPLADKFAAAYGLKVLDKASDYTIFSGLNPPQLPKFTVRRLVFYPAFFDASGMTGEEFAQLLLGKYRFVGNKLHDGSKKDQCNQCLVGLLATGEAVMLRMEGDSWALEVEQASEDYAKLFRPPKL